MGARGHARRKPGRLSDCRGETPSSDERGLRRLTSSVRSRVAFGQLTGVGTLFRMPTWSILGERHADWKRSLDSFSRQGVLGVWGCLGLFDHVTTLSSPPPTCLQHLSTRYRTRYSLPLLEINCRCSSKPRSECETASGHNPYTGARDRSRPGLGAAITTSTASTGLGEVC